MTEARNARKVYQGRVVSDKMDKTITVATLFMVSVLSTRRSLRLTMKTTKLSKVTSYASWRRVQRQLQSASVW